MFSPVFILSAAGSVLFAVAYVVCWFFIVMILNEGYRDEDEVRISRRVDTAVEFLFWILALFLAVFAAVVVCFFGAVFAMASVGPGVAYGVKRLRPARSPALCAC